MTGGNDPIEGEYEHAPLPAQQQPHKRNARGWGALGAGALVILAKFKTLLLFLAQFKFALLGLKILAGSWTFILSLGLYVAAFGWKLGLVIVFSLAAHELGHYFAYRGYGLPARLPVFVPFLGAFTAGAIAPDLETDAYIALAGPATGLALAGACYGLGLAGNDPFWFACANISAFLNLFNMIPLLPFDGGRAIGAVWPPLWIAGVAAFIAAAVLLHVPLLFVAIIALLGLPPMWQALRGQTDPRAAQMTAGARVRVGFWYVAIVTALVVVLGQAQAAMPGRAAL
jgi:Zn-dependent protease